MDQDETSPNVGNTLAEPMTVAPQAAMDIFDRGARAYLTDDNAAAVDLLARAAADGLPEAAYLLGLAQLRAGNREAAAAALKQAAETTGNVMLRDYAQKKLARVVSA